jgi:hypothetical protein
MLTVNVQDADTAKVAAARASNPRGVQLVSRSSALLTPDRLDDPVHPGGSDGDDSRGGDLQGAVLHVSR